MACNIMPCIVSTIVHPLKICPMFMKEVLYLKKLEKTFEILTIGHGLTLLQQMEYCNELQIFLFYLATICNLNCNSVDTTFRSIQLLILHMKVTKPYKIIFNFHFGSTHLTFSQC
jgi:hypothetical protein